MPASTFDCIFMVNKRRSDGWYAGNTVGYIYTRFDLAL